MTVPDPVSSVAQAAAGLPRAHSDNELSRTGARQPTKLCALEKSHTNESDIHGNDEDNDDDTPKYLYRYALLFQRARAFTLESSDADSETGGFTDYVYFCILASLYIKGILVIESIV